MSTEKDVKPSVIPRKLPSQKRSRIVVDSILEATAHILSTGGLETFNTNEIARVAGVSIGSLYQFFPNKDSILAAFVDRQLTTDFNKMSHLLIIGIEEHTTSREALIETLVGELVEIYCKNRKLRRIIFEQVPRLDLQKKREHCLVQLRWLIRSALFKGKEGSEDKEVPFEVVFRAIWGVIVSAFTDDSFNVQPQELREQLARLLSLVH